MEESIEKKRQELLDLNRLWSKTQELDLNDATLKKVKNKIMSRISICEESILKLQKLN